MTLYTLVTGLFGLSLSSGISATSVGLLSSSSTVWTETIYKQVSLGTNGPIQMGLFGDKVGLVNTKRKAVWLFTITPCFFK